MEDVYHFVLVIGRGQVPADLSLEVTVRSLGGGRRENIQLEGLERDLKTYIHKMPHTLHINKVSILFCKQKHVYLSTKPICCHSCKYHMPAVAQCHTKLCYILVNIQLATDDLSMEYEGVLICCVPSEIIKQKQHSQLVNDEI